MRALADFVMRGRLQATFAVVIAAALPLLFWVSAAAGSLAPISVAASTASRSPRPEEGLRRVPLFGSIAIRCATLSVLVLSVPHLRLGRRRNGIGVAFLAQL